MATVFGKRRVVITGMGVACPIALDLNTFFNSLISSKSAVRRLTELDEPDIENFPVKVYAPIHADFAENEVAREMGPYASRIYAFSYYSAIKAVEDSGWHPDMEACKSRIAVTFASSLGPVPRINKGYVDSLKGFSHIDPYLGIASSIGQGASFITNRFGITGPTYCIGTTCAAGQAIIGEGMRMIQRGEADIAICSSTEDNTKHLSVLNFVALGAMSVSKREPTDISRPFDADRDGFIGADGAGTVIVEDLEHARQRGAKIYAELLGAAQTTDAYSLLRPLKDGASAQRAMQTAMKEAKIVPGQVNLYYAHGPSTKVGDETEATNIYRVFGSPGPYVTSMKGNLGYLRSSSGTVQTIGAALATQNDTIPPICNTKNPIKIDGKPLNFVIGEACRTRVDYTMSCALGLGGPNSILVLGKYKD